MLAACAGAQQPPAVTATIVTSQPAAPPELSTIVIPLRASLAPLLPQLEAQVPKSMQKLDAYEMDSAQRFGLKYKVAREPIALTMIGTGLHANVTVHYALEGCKRTVSPMTGAAYLGPCISCGFGEPMRDALIAIHSHLEWDAAWRIRSRTTARPVEFTKRCTVTFFGVDISDWKIAPIVNEQLRDVVKTIDTNTPKLTNLRPVAQQVWATLQTPIELAPNTWLLLEPADVALGPIIGSGLNATSTLTLRARTRVVVGAKPAVAAKPLPALRTESQTANGMRVPFDVELSYDEASRLLNEQFAGKTFADVKVESLRLGPAENGRLTIEANVDYRGGGMKKYHGLVMLIGTPHFDAATSRVSLTDLDYALDPKRRSLFLRIADRVAHDTLRARLQENASWPIGTEIAAMRAEIDRGMTRKLAPGVLLEGHVDSIEPLSLEARPEGIVVHVVAVGTAAVQISALS